VGGSVLGRNGTVFCVCCWKKIKRSSPWNGFKESMYKDKVCLRDLLITFFPRLMYGMCWKVDYQSHIQLSND
jgi:hypothetical protein